MDAAHLAPPFAHALAPAFLPFPSLFFTCKIVGPLSSFLLIHPKHTCLDWNGGE